MDEKEHARLSALVERARLSELHRETREDLGQAIKTLKRVREKKIDSPYLTAREAMAYLKVGSSSALYRLIREHRMPFCRMGRLYRFDTRELDAWAHGHGSSLEMLRAQRRKA